MELVNKENMFFRSRKIYEIEFVKMLKLIKKFLNNKINFNTSQNKNKLLQKNKKNNYSLPIIIKPAFLLDTISLF